MSHIYLFFMDNPQEVFKVEHLTPYYSVFAMIFQETAKLEYQKRLKAFNILDWKPNFATQKSMSPFVPSRLQS